VCVCVCDMDRRQFFLCPHANCNRKYKLEKTCVQHQIKVHGAKQPILPEASIVAKSKSGCASNRRVREDSKLNEARRLRELEREAKRKAEEVLVQRHGADFVNQEELALSIKQRVRDRPGECAICLENGTDAACVPCGHAYFCFGCLSEWTNNKGSCPFCRQETSMVLKLYQ